ncbi:MAG: AbrB/MazE/SpoVT family DNA-binding domain-containing protein [Candidatus Woesearchaeota archaeon]
MKKCSSCGKLTILKKANTKDGIPYEYYSCKYCGEEFLDMTQLGKVADKYGEYKRMKAKLSRWGVSLGVRIPKELVQKYNLKEKSEVTFIPEEGSIRIIV